MADDKDEVVPSPDVFFEPVVVLPEVTICTLEEDEEELLKLRGKLYRFVSTEDPPEWKERGLGEVKILKHKVKKSCRILMRRDKTLKICANHKILPWMELKPNCGSDKAWVWNTPADFSDEEPKTELLALRFGSAENAKKFKDIFDECKDYVLVNCEPENEADDSQSNFLKKLSKYLNAAEENGDDDDTDTEGEEDEDEKEVTEKLKELKVKEDQSAKGDDDESSKKDEGSKTEESKEEDKKE